MKMNQLIVIVFILLGVINLSAQPASESKEVVKMKKQHWKVGNKSSVKIKGLNLGDNGCEKFDIYFSEKLEFQIECGEFKNSQELSLANSNTHTVTKRNGYTTITKYGYLIKRPQVSQLDQSTLKVPFVSQIIHISKNSNSELAFYLESFKVDEFGRIVQDQFIQAHTLSVLDRKVSAYSKSMK